MTEKDIAFYATKIDQLSQRMKFVEENSIAGLRDFFATSALSFLANENVYGMDYNVERVADRAYSLADAMMKRREYK